MSRTHIGPAACVLAACFAVSSSAFAATLQVGPGKTYAKPCDANAAAKDGDIVEIDAAGDYHGDVCQWSQNNLTLRGVNGRAKIDATGVSISNGKGIWVFYGANVTVENIEFSGAEVPDQNGAGIRHQGLNLTVRNCYFHDNQDGILGAPLANGQGADGQGEVLIETSEFAKNGAGDGQSHNMYLNHYAKVTLRYSYSHSSNVGHLLKSRALATYVLYNRLSDDESTNVSYEVNLPNGGNAYIIGNIIEQGADPNGEENGNIIDFGSEGPVNGSALFVVNNTIINNRTKGGTFVNVNGGVTTASILRNNIFVGSGTLCNQASATLDHNFSMGDPKLVDATNLDAHLQTGSPCVDMGVAPGMGGGQDLTPLFHYVHPASFEARTSVGTIDIGAYELGGGGGAGGGTSSSSSSGTATTSSGTTSTSSGTTSGGGAGGSGGEAGTGGSGGSGGDGSTGEKSGCGCRVGGEESSGGAAALIALAGLAALRRRRVK
jgi:MYXO-CTERM domain-containing protein